MYLEVVYCFCENKWSLNSWFFFYLHIYYCQQMWIKPLNYVDSCSDRKEKRTFSDHAVKFNPYVCLGRSCPSDSVSLKLTNMSKSFSILMHLILMSFLLFKKNYNSSWTPQLLSGFVGDTFLNEDINDSCLPKKKRLCLIRNISSQIWVGTGG